jgi:hypothetical protein
MSAESLKFLFRSILNGEEVFKYFRQFERILAQTSWLGLIPQIFVRQKFNLGPIQRNYKYKSEHPLTMEAM